MTSREDTPAMTCIVADDHDELRRTICDALAALGWIDVRSSVADGRAALRQIVEHRPDLAVLDIRMAGIDGVEVCRSVAERDLPTRVVLFSASASDSIARTALAAGAAAVVSKLDGLEALGGTLEQLRFAQPAR